MSHIWWFHSSTTTFYSTNWFSLTRNFPSMYMLDFWETKHTKVLHWSINRCVRYSVCELSFPKKKSISSIRQNYTFYFWETLIFLSGVLPYFVSQKSFVHFGFLDFLTLVFYLFWWHLVQFFFCILRRYLHVLVHIPRKKIFYRKISLYNTKNDSPYVFTWTKLN